MAGGQEQEAGAAGWQGGYSRFLVVSFGQGSGPGSGCGSSSLGAGHLGPAAAGRPGNRGDGLGGGGFSAQRPRSLGCEGSWVATGRAAVGPLTCLYYPGGTNSQEEGPDALILQKTLPHSGLQRLGPKPLL